LISFVFPLLRVAITRIIGCRIQTSHIYEQKFNKYDTINHAILFVKFFQLLVGFQKILYTMDDGDILPEPCMKNDEDLYN